MLYRCPTCNGSGKITKRVASRRKGEGDETVEVDCNVCDGSGQCESPPA